MLGAVTVAELELFIVHRHSEFEQFVFAAADSLEAPVLVGDFGDESDFGGSGRLVFFVEALDKLVEGFRIFAGQDGGFGTKAMDAGVLGRDGLTS